MAVSGAGAGAGVAAWWLYALAFLSGALAFGYWAGQLKGIDIRQHGSGNIGATNVLRVLGPRWGVPVLLLDALKGFAPVWLAGLLATRGQLPLSGWEIVAIGFCAILGHLFSPFVRFKGGKGVATALGVSIGFSLPVAGVALLVFLATVFLTRYVSLGSMLAAIAAALAFFFLPASLLPPDPWPFRVFGVLVAVFIVYAHRSNIHRLRQGTENRFGERKPPSEESRPPDN